MGKSELIAQTLADVNAIRSDFGQRPLARLPKGRPGKNDGCVIFWALQGCNVKCVTTAGVKFHGPEETFRMVTPDMAEFIKAFDGNKFPGLVTAKTGPQVLEFVVHIQVDGFKEWADDLINEAVVAYHGLPTQDKKEEYALVL